MNGGQTQAHARAAARAAESGFSLMEAIVATVISVIAVLGLAYSFGLGRGFINRYEAARIADGLAAGAMDSLSLAGTDLTLGGPRPNPAIPLVYNGVAIGTVNWVVSAPDPANPVKDDLVNVTVTANWSLGGLNDSLQYRRLFAKP